MYACREAALSPVDYLLRVTAAEVLRPALDTARQLLERLRTAAHGSAPGTAAAARMALSAGGGDGVGTQATAKPGLKVLGLRARFPAAGACPIADPSRARQSSMNTTVSAAVG